MNDIGSSCPGGEIGMDLKAKDDDTFAGMINMVEVEYGRILSVNEIEILVYIYDQLGFSIDLIDYLFKFCASMGKKNLRYIEAVARNWYEAGVKTVEDARKNSEKFAFYKKIYRMLGIERSPTRIEIDYMKEWESSFDQSMILEACKRAVLAKPNSVSLPYVNAILLNWQKNNVKDMRELEEFEERYKNRKSKKYAFSNFEQKDMTQELDEMEQLFLTEINGS